MTPLPSGPGLTYTSAGVSIAAGNELVQAIKPLVRSTRRRGAEDAEIGGFGGIFDLKSILGSAPGQIKDPILVSGTDGVGTKLRIAIDVGIHETVGESLNLTRSLKVAQRRHIGIDLVAMSVNDLLVQGADPLFFLDYYGCSKLDVQIAREVIKGIAEGCRQSGCVLSGGETAETPGMYHEGK